MLSIAMKWKGTPEEGEDGIYTALTSRVSTRRKIQALVYDILLSTTAVLSYAIGSTKLSANEQLFFVGAQMISDVCFMLPCCLRRLKSNQNRFNRDGTPLFFYPGWMCLMFTCVLGR